jgi:hypothetical protein
MNKLIINQEVTTEDTHNPGEEAHRWREAWGHHQAAARTITMAASGNTALPQMQASSLSHIHSVAFKHLLRVVY